LLDYSFEPIKVKVNPH